MIVLDASVLIAYLDGDDSHHTAAESVLVAAVDDNLAASSITLAEVLVAPVREGRLDQTLAALSDLEIQELPLPADSAVQLARLRAGLGLKMPDCCVLLATEDAAAATIATFDGRLAQAATGRGLLVLRG